MIHSAKVFSCFAMCELGGEVSNIYDVGRIVQSCLRKARGLGVNGMLFFSCDTLVARVNDGEFW